MDTIGLILDTNKLLSLKIELQEVAHKKCGSDNTDFDIYGSCGGNYDDAYDLGSNDGKILLARRLLEKFFHE